jgi:hypothetical protein
MIVLNYSLGYTIRNNTLDYALGYALGNNLIYTYGILYVILGGCSRLYSRLCSN